MSMHPRFQEVNSAEHKLGEFVMQLVQDHNLTFVELTQLLLDEVNRHAKYEKRAERHPKCDCPADRWCSHDEDGERKELKKLTAIQRDALRMVRDREPTEALQGDAPELEALTELVRKKLAVRRLPGLKVWDLTEKGVRFGALLAEGSRP